ncbi:hypothetical protein GCM10009087_04800 [Sphingomonas oligophenolica]
MLGQFRWIEIDHLIAVRIAWDALSPVRHENIGDPLASRFCAILDGHDIGARTVYDVRDPLVIIDRAGGRGDDVDPGGRDCAGFWEPRRILAL